jgi:hypothetical protein
MPNCFTVNYKGSGAYSSWCLGQAIRRLCREGLARSFRYKLNGDSTIYPGRTARHTKSRQLRRNPSGEPPLLTPSPSITVTPPAVYHCHAARMLLDSRDAPSSFRTSRTDEPYR